MGWKLVVIRKLTIEWNKISILKNLNVYSPPKFRIELYIWQLLERFEIVWAS